MAPAEWSLFACPQPGEAKNAAALAAGSKLKHLSLAETNLTMEIAQLLLSLLHAWGLDNDLDKARGPFV